MRQALVLLFLIVAAASAQVELPICRSLAQCNSAALKAYRLTDALVPLVTSVAGPGENAARATCPEGSFALSGGCTCHGIGAVLVTNGFPAEETGKLPDAWVCEATGPNATMCTASVLCVKINP